MDTLVETTHQLKRRAATSANAFAEMRTLGNFRLLRRIASGGMSTVYLGFDEKNNQGLFAIKILAPELAEYPEAVERFRFEGQIGRRLSHANLVHCHEIVADVNAPVNYLVMDYVSGTTGMQLLDQQGPLNVRVVARIAMDIAEALQELHDHGYMHLDIKPANILIEDTGTAKLGDFGVTRPIKATASPEQLPELGVGTPYYMAFEQMRNSPNLDVRADLYALGVTIYQLLTNRVPFPGDSFDEVYRNKESGDYRPATDWIPGLPPIVDTMLARMLERDPLNRLPNAKSLKALLKSSGLLEKTVYIPNAANPVDDQDPTKKDVKARHDEPLPPRSTTPLWKVQYRTAEGKLMQINARISTIERYVEEGRIPPKFQVLVEGEFKSFQLVPAFQHLSERATELLATILPTKDAQTRKAPKFRRRYGQYLFACMLAILVTAVASLCYHWVGWSNGS